MARRPLSEQERKRRRADDTCRWRRRKRRGARLFKIEVGEREISLAMKFGDLKTDQLNDPDTVTSALSRLLGKGLAALLNDETTSLKKL